MAQEHLLEEDYWHLVKADPRDWNEDQKILFWWVVTLLSRVGPQGVIAAPGQAPLNDEQIKAVFEEILPQTPDRRGEKTYLDKFWSYDGQLIILPSSDDHFVMIEAGKVVVRDDPDADKREKL